ncbi:hypothetical protein KR222_011725 [Zaprionus bogoriensis]|nr:hypothetical protein KR222_011725 [Zaprionus bogoriensis]
MLLLYIRYSLLLLLMIGHNEDDPMLLQQLSEDETLLKVAACSNLCLQSIPQKSFDECLDFCRYGNSSALMPTTLQKVQENFLLKLVCRTESELSFRIDWVQHSRDNSTVAAEPKATFIIRIQVKLEEAMDSLIYLSNDTFFTIPMLRANTTHTITALAVHTDGAHSLITKNEDFKTLRAGYQPGRMGMVQVRSFQQQPDNWERIQAQIEWLPSADRNCHFDIIFFSTETTSLDAALPVQIRDPRQLYTYTIADMDFGDQYKVGVRTVNGKNNLESPVYWLMVKTPSCLDWFHFNYTLCGEMTYHRVYCVLSRTLLNSCFSAFLAPLGPSDLSVQQEHLQQDVLALNVSWALPTQLPDYYSLHILDLHRDGEQCTIEVEGNASFYYISKMKVLGASFEVHLVAHTTGGQNASVLYVNKIPLKQWPKSLSQTKLILFLFVPICCIVLLCTLTLGWNRRHECKHLEIKELKVTANQSSDFHLSIMHNSTLLASIAVEDNFELDDELEVEPHAVLLQDVLGEGAFGLVRRGVYKQRQVAVKLLKDHPNEEDVQAFRCEIQMLKAVGKHPNIVSIVGYSTRCSNRMMLLTEYCSLGSLQSFLRDEWKFRQERNAQEMRLRLSQRSGKVRAVRPLDHDTRIEDINSSMLSTLEEENETDLSRSSNPNDTYQAIFAADNKSYGLQEIQNIDATPVAPSKKALLKRPTCKPKRKPAKSCAVSFENQEYFQSPAANATQLVAQRQPLTYADLLDIAQQVAVGMDFLAQNKIVHRDLAARNVLISLDRTIKIADFGLSRDVYHENVYRKSSSGKLPIKWLALESLTHQVYTSQSDVWSFGVLLYEITTLGGMPYPSISPRDLLQLLREGQRMQRPEGCTDELFAMMESCWCSIPASRPTFAELKQRLDAMIIATNELPERLKQQR